MSILENSCKAALFKNGQFCYYSTFQSFLSNFRFWLTFFFIINSILYNIIERKKKPIFELENIKVKRAHTIQRGAECVMNKYS